MDFALSMKYTNIELQKLNACRLYKGVTLASDVTTINGRKIRSDMMNDQKPLDNHKGIIPFQSKPNSSSWKLWKHLLKSFSNEHFALQHPLGKWIATGEKLHRQWNSYYDDRRKIMYLRKMGKYKHYQVCNN